MYLEHIISIVRKLEICMFLQQAFSRRNEPVSMSEHPQLKQTFCFPSATVDMQAVCHAKFNMHGVCSHSKICAWPCLFADMKHWAYKAL